MVCKAALFPGLGFAHFAPAHMTKAAYVMDEVHSLLTDTKLAQSNGKRVSQ
jgi:hypothetical protein